MKQKFKKILQTPFFWFFTKKIFGIIDKLHFIKEEVRKDFIRKSDHYLEKTFFQNLEVKGGVFQGISYPEKTSFGSALYPKLVGTYELEIQPVLEGIVEQKEIKQIIDVGCAEGYYAVGLAYRMSETKVYAYDIEQKARSLCQAMAEKNGVINQVFIKEYFGSNTITGFDTNIPTLIICDCEGYEYELFTKENVHLFKQCTLIIELHDFINPNISTTLIDLFLETHEIQILKGQNRKTSNHTTLLKGLNAFQKEYVLNEHRPCLMDWLYCKPKPTVAHA